MNNVLSKLRRISLKLNLLNKTYVNIPLSYTFLMFDMCLEKLNEVALKKISFSFKNLFIRCAKSKNRMSAIYRSVYLLKQNQKLRTTTVNGV